MAETTIRVKENTRSLILKIKGLWQYQTAKRITMNDVIKKLAEEELKRHSP